MKLSKAQQEVVNLLSDGWEIGHSLTFDGRFWIQKGGAGRGGESKNLNANTACALIKAGIIICTERGFPTARYSLPPSQ